MSQDFVSNFGSRSSQTFNNIERLPTIQNFQRFKNALGKFVFTTDGNILPDKSIYLVALSMGRQDKLNVNDLTIVFEFVTKLLSFVNGISYEKARFTILLDRSEDTIENFEANLNFFASFQQQISKLIAIKPQQGFGSWFTKNGTSSNQNWLPSKLQILDKSSSIPLPINLLPLQLNGTFASNDLWWNDSLVAMGNYFLSIRSLSFSLKTLRNALFQLWSSSSQTEIEKFHSNPENKLTFEKLKFQITSMISNRKEIMEFFSSSSPNYSNFQFIMVCGGRIIGLAESLSNLHEELIEENNKYLNSSNEIQNLSKYLEVQCVFIEDQAKIILDQVYSLEKFTSWIQQVNDNIITKEYVINKIKGEIEARNKFFTVESDVLNQKCEKIYHELDTFSKLIEKQTDLLIKFLDKLSITLKKVIDEPNNDNLLQIDGIGDLVIFIRQDMEEIKSKVKSCKSLPKEIVKKINDVVGLKCCLDLSISKIMALTNNSKSVDNKIIIYQPTEEKINTQGLITPYNPNVNDDSEKSDASGNSGSTFDDLVDEIRSDKEKEKRRKKEKEKERRKREYERYRDQKKRRSDDHRRKNKELHEDGIQISRVMQIDSNGSMVISNSKQMVKKGVRYSEKEKVIFNKKPSSSQSSSNQSTNALSHLAGLIGLVGINSSSPRIQNFKENESNNFPKLKDNKNLPFIDEID